MTVTTEIGARPLADLIKQVQAGDEVLLTQGNKPVAKLVSAASEAIFPAMPVHIRTLRGCRKITFTF